MLLHHPQAGMELVVVSTLYVGWYAMLSLLIEPEHEKRDRTSFLVDCEISTFFLFLEWSTNLAKKKPFQKIA